MGTLRFFEEVVSFKIRRTFGFADYTSRDLRDYRNCRFFLPPPKTNARLPVCRLGAICSAPNSKAFCTNRAQHRIVFYNISEPIRAMNRSLFPKPTRSSTSAYSKAYRARSARECNPLAEIPRNSTNALSGASSIMLSTREKVAATRFRVVHPSNRIIETISTYIQ